MCLHWDGPQGVRESLARPALSCRSKEGWGTGLRFVDRWPLIVFTMNVAIQIKQWRMCAWQLQHHHDLVIFVIYELARGQVWSPKVDSLDSIDSLETIYGLDSLDLLDSLDSLGPTRCSSAPLLENL